MTTGSITDRMRGAAMLDVATYEEVEADESATGQAAMVVAIVAVCAAIGGARHGHAGVIAGLVKAFVDWLIWAGVTYVVGTSVFRGTATWGELLRTLGFAQAPGVLYVLGIIPALGRVAVVVVAIWSLVTGVVAIRQALDISTGKAILTALISLAVIICVGILLSLVFGLLFGITGAVFGSFSH